MGWQSRVRYLPQPPLASGVLTLVVQSFGHSRVAAAQPQPLRPALLLQHLPAKALAEEKNCHRAAGQSPSSSFQKLLPPPHIPGPGPHHHSPSPAERSSRTHLGVSLEGANLLPGHSPVLQTIAQALLQPHPDRVPRVLIAAI